MKVVDVINRVRTTAGDINVLQFSDQNVLDWINDGIRQCALDNKLLQKRGTQLTVSSQSDYDLPSDILKLHSVKFDNKKLTILTLEQFDEYYPGGSGTTGEPDICYIWAAKLTLFPAPNSAKNLVIDYIYGPTPHLIANIANDEVSLPVGYHSRIVDYCLAQVALQDDDLNRYQMKMEEFATGVQKLKDDPEWEYDLYPFMSLDARDAGNGYYGWD